MTNLTTILENHLNTFSGSELVNIYNSTVPESKHTKRFSTKKNGIERCLAAILAYTDRTKLGYGLAEIFAEYDKQNKTNKSKVPFSGKSSKFTGSILHSTVKVNPRREGTWGYRSFQIILDAGEAGISYEDFLAKGGRNKDLTWDFNHGFCSADDEKKELMYKDRDSSKLL